MNGTHATEHPWTDFAAAYALDALDPDERVQFEEHLAACARCKAEVGEMREVADALAFAPPPAAPPPALRERILSEAHQVRPLHAARQQKLDRRPQMGRLVTAASVVLALVAGWSYWQETQESAALAREYANTRAELAERDSLLGALLSPQIQTIQLTSSDRAPAVRLFWNRDRGLVVLTAANLPPAASGRTYQLWGIAQGQAPVSLGTFNTSADGEVQLTAKVPSGLQLAVSAITEEPEGGSPQPTTTPFLVGEWSE